MSGTEPVVPVLTLVCGITDGGGRPHHAVLDVVGVEHGRVIGGFLPVEGPDRTRWVTAVCRKHGTVAATEAEVVAARQGGRKMLPLATRVPWMRVARA